MDQSALAGAPGFAQCEGEAIDQASLPTSIGAFLAILLERIPKGEIVAMPLVGELRRWSFTLLWQQAWACFLGGYPVVIAPLDSPADGLPRGCITWEASPPPAEPGALPPPMANKAIAAYLPTSGTTGQSRFVCLSEHALRTRFCGRFTGFGDRQRDDQDCTAAHLVLFPWHSVTGMSVFFPRVPRTFCIDTQVMLASPRRLHALMEQERVSYLALSSSLAVLLNETLRLSDRRWDLSALKRIGIGVEPVVPAVFRELRERLVGYGAMPIMLAGYGMTETGLLCGMTADTELAQTWLLGEAPVCLGRPTAGWRLRVVDDQDRLLAAGEEGHLQVDSADKGFSGYLGDDNKSLATFSADGWFRTGDLGLIRDGQVTVTGRSKETLIIHGAKYLPERIERLVRDLPGIWQGQVYACPVRGADSVTDGLGIAFVPCPDGPFDDQLAQTVKAIRRRLAEQMRLPVREVLPLPASEIPRASTGKVRRLELGRRMRLTISDSLPRERSAAHPNCSPIRSVAATRSTG
ncbi:MAG: AMP-binding protein [Chromatiaceae bacterium]|nr:AMP-binding protein [Chromatiaceae bacterium]